MEYAVRQSQADGFYFESGLVMCICQTRDEAEAKAKWYFEHRGKSKFTYRVEEWKKNEPDMTSAYMGYL